MASENEIWPALDYPAWRDTALTLQLWTQIVGKVRLALTPWLNHSWQVPLYVSARGLTTGPIPVGKEILEIEFDFHRASPAGAHQPRRRSGAGAEAAERRGILSRRPRCRCSAWMSRRDQRAAERDAGPDPLFARSRASLL